MTIKLQQSGAAWGMYLWIGLISKQFAASSQVCSTKGARWPADGKLRDSHHGKKITLARLLLIALSHSGKSRHTHTHTQRRLHIAFPFLWVHSRPRRHSGKHTFPFSSTYTVSSSCRLWGRLSDEVPHSVHLAHDWVFGAETDLRWKVSFPRKPCTSAKFMEQ